MSFSASICAKCIRSSASRSSYSRKFHSTAPRNLDPPLKGIKIVDLTRVLAGPYASMLLADLGAEVIKIENPKSGDDTRGWHPPSAPTRKSQRSQTDDLDRNWDDLPPESAYFLTVNRNKRSLTVNLKSTKGQDLVRELVKKADIVLENYVPGKLKKLRLSYEDCKELNPSIIYASITGYGQTGPYRTSPGYDVMVEAEAGLMHITGEPDSKPVKVGVAITDLTTGLYVHGAVMAALIGRQKTGKGCWIDCSLFESQIASLANIGSNYLIAGQEATRQGTAHPSIVPYQTFPTSDGFIMIGAGNDGQFNKLCTLLSATWSTDCRFLTNTSRVANRTKLISLMTEKFLQRPTKEWLEIFTDQGLPFAPINNIRQTFEHPQSIARGVVTKVEHSRCGEISLLSPAVSYDGEKMKVTRPPPVLGEHTAEILREELGMRIDEIKELKQEGVF